jgi:hypothetical protein
MQGVKGQRDTLQPRPNELGLALLPMLHLLALAGMRRILRLRLAGAIEIGSFFSPVCCRCCGWQGYRTFISTNLLHQGLFVTASYVLPLCNLL